MNEPNRLISAKVEQAKDDNFCDWCSTPRHQGLGIIAQYRLVNTYGVVLGHVCKGCLLNFPMDEEQA